MEILVCIKQVPAVMKIKLDPETNKMIRDGVPNVLNPVDKNAIEAAVALKEAVGGSVTLLTMGPPAAEEVLREGIVQGADKAALVGDMKFAGSDTLATAKTLAAAANVLGRFDAVFCGDFSADGSTGQIGAKLSERMGMALVSHVAKVEALDGKLKVQREHELGFEEIEASLPVVVSVTKNINVPRSPSIKDKMAAKKAVITKLAFADLSGISEGDVGSAGSPTVVSRTFAPPKKEKGIIIDAGNGKDGMLALMDKLIAAKLV